MSVISIGRRELQNQSTVKATKAISRAFALTPRVFLNAAIIIFSETVTLNSILVHLAVARLY